MGLREFRDSAGTTWTVWDVTSEGFSERAAAQYHATASQNGWLVFDSADARRRMVGHPSSWATMSDAELEQLLAAAEPVKRRISGENVAIGATPQSAPRVLPDESAENSARPTPPVNRQARTFTDGTGRAFVAALVRLVPPPRASIDGPATVGETVLRFVSGRLVLDLAAWPDDWERQSDRQLIDMLRGAQPADPASIRTAEPLWVERDQGSGVGDRE